MEKELKNNWKNVVEQISYSEGGITSKVMEKNEFGDVTLFCMSKNTSISEHTSTKAGYVYVVEGEGTFVLAGKNIEMKKGVLIFMDANAKHSLNAKENTSFILILKKM
ncbi:MAG: cupin domain-containing protein [Candidatus Nanoarchaeia archaeon]